MTGEWRHSSRAGSSFKPRLPLAGQRLATWAETSRLLAAVRNQGYGQRTDVVVGDGAPQGSPAGRTQMPRCVEDRMHAL